MPDRYQHECLGLFDNDDGDTSEDEEDERSYSQETDELNEILDKKNSIILELEAELGGKRRNIR